MDDLRRFVAVGVKGRQREASRAKVIVDEELDRYRSTTTAREAAPLVTAAATRGRPRAAFGVEVDRPRRRARGLDETQRAAVEALTKGIVAKLLHEPTVRLKDAAGTAKGDRLSDALRDLFDL